MTPSPSSRSRDAALRRLARCNRWLLAGSATLTGAFTLLAAQAFPGRTASAATKGADTKGKSSTKGDRAAKRVTTATDSTKPLKAASQAPAAASSSTTTQKTETDPTQTTTTEQATPTEATTTAETTTATTPVETAKTTETEAQTPSASSESSTVVSGGS